MKKIFYSVTYSGLFEGTKMAWFTDKASAKKFSNQDYHDDVKTHRISNQLTIAYLDELSQYSEFELSLG